MTTQAVTPQIEGLPPGAIVGPPLQSSGAQIEGLPAGAIVGPPLGQTLQSRAAGPEPTLSDTQIPAGPLTGFTVGQVVGGAKETGQDIWSAIKAAPMALTGGAGTAGSTIYENIKESIPVIHAYETARSQGKGVIDSLSAANDEAKRQQDARSVLKQRIEEFKANPGQESIRAIGDAAALAASIYAGSKISLNPEAAAAEAGEEATGAEAAEQPKVSAKEARIQKSVGKAGLEEGQAAQPAKTTVTPATKTVVEGTGPIQPPQATMHEPILQNQVRTQVNKLAEGEGLKPVSDATDLRDVGKELSDQFYNRSKAGFQQIKEATGIDVNVIRDQIQDLYAKKAETFADSEKEGAIIERINKLEDEADQAFKSAKEAGVDTDKPLSDWKKAKAASDYGEQVRSSVDPHQKMGTFDTGKYAPRLEKLYRSNPKYPNQPGRLEQLFGKASAEAMRDDAYAADETSQALKNFKPQPGTPDTVIKTPATKTTTPATPATESKALYEMVRQNTGRRFGVLDERTNWVKTYADFDKLSPEERAARFSNPQAVEKTLLKQAKSQRLRVIAGGVAVGALAHEFGVDGFILRKLVGE